MVPEYLIEKLLAARSVVVLTGSGMSAESGIPTFRDALTGTWSRFRPEDLATPEAFSRDPARVWQWYESRRARVRAASPHAGYEALVRIQSMVAAMTIVTQNVDGLHQRSGCERVLELHGNILRSVCAGTGRVIPDRWIENAKDIPPGSPHQEGALARPDVVWFGESLPRAVLDQAMASLGDCDVCLCVGTSAVVEPAASLPLLAKRSGALLIEINPAATPLSRHADHVFRLTAGLALGRLADALESAVAG